MAVVPAARIERCILLIRKRKVMLDEDLAALYGVETRVLIQSVKRNIARFPDDFMFRLTGGEASALRSQIVTSNAGRGGRRYLPYAFTEQGVAMLSSVLRSKQAVAVNIAIMRAFVRLRRVLSSHRALREKIAELERQFTDRTDGHDRHIRRIYELLEQLMEPPASSLKTRIGFRPDSEEQAECS